MKTRFYFDFGTYVTEITDTVLCAHVVRCYLEDETDWELGIGEVFLSPASNNFLVTPI